MIISHLKHFQRTLLNFQKTNFNYPLTNGLVNVFSTTAYIKCAAKSQEPTKKPPISDEQKKANERILNATSSLVESSDKHDHQQVSTEVKFTQKGLFLKK